MKVKLNEISNSTKFFTRQEIDEKVVTKYSELLRAGTDFPPITVVHDEETGRYVILDGFHTYHATLAAELDQIDILIVDKTNDLTLIVESLKKNSLHGKPLTTKDKRMNIERILSYEEGHKWSDGYIAKIVGACDRTVSTARTYLSPKFSGKDETKCVRNGVVQTRSIPDSGKKEYQLALAACQSPTIISADQKHITSNAEGVTKEIDFDNSYQLSGAATQIFGENITPQIDTMTVITSMKSLQQKCTEYSRLYDSVNDGELIDFKLHSKLIQIVNDVKGRSNELLDALGNGDSDA